MSQRIRDSHVEPGYWDEGVDYFRGGLRSNAAYLATTPREAYAQPAAQAWTADSVLTEAWVAFSAEYSAGVPHAHLRDRYLEIVDHAATAARIARDVLPPRELHTRYERRYAKQIEFYRQYLWLTSLAVAFDVDDDAFDKVVDATWPAHRDQAISRLIAARRPSFPLGEATPYKTLETALDKAWTAPDPLKPLASYLRDWPRWWKRERWVGSHADPAQLQARYYFGYWAFETTGIVKALNLNDTPLRTNDYYPAAILHPDT